MEINMEIRKLIVILSLMAPVSATYADGMPEDAMNMAKEAASEKAEATKENATEAATEKTEDTEGGFMDKAKDKAMEMGGKLMGK